MCCEKWKGGGNGLFFYNGSICFGGARWRQTPGLFSVVKAVKANWDRETFWVVGSHDKFAQEGESRFWIWESIFGMELGFQLRASLYYSMATTVGITIVGITIVGTTTVGVSIVGITVVGITVVSIPVVGISTVSTTIGVHYEHHHCGHLYYGHHCERPLSHWTVHAAISPPVCQAS